MSTIMEKIGTWFSAIAFAEAGEHETALRMVGLTPTKSTQSVSVFETLNTSFAAAAFAEADCPDVASQILDPVPTRQTFAEVVGLKGVRVRFGRVSLREESFLETLGISGVNMRLGVVSL
jgi:hypothetical protein